MTDSPEHIAIRLDFLRAHIASAVKVADDLVAGMGIAEASALHAARCFAAELTAAQAVMDLALPKFREGGIVAGDMKGSVVRITDDEMVIDPKGSPEIRAMLPDGWVRH